MGYDSNNESNRFRIPDDLRKRLDMLKTQKFTEESEKELTSIWSEFMQRLKDSGIENNEWDHPDFVKERKKQEDKVRQEIIRDRELTSR
jgi:predicted transcriptional regulator